jgi:hypothetical protein
MIGVDNDPDRPGTAHLDLNGQAFKQTLHATTFMDFKNFRHAVIF